MRDLRHENLVPFIGACVETGHISILTQLCARGNLNDVLNNADYPLDNMFIRLSAHKSLDYTFSRLLEDSNSYFVEDLMISTQINRRSPWDSKPSRRFGHKSLDYTCSRILWARTFSYFGHELMI